MLLSHPPHILPISPLFAFLLPSYHISPLFQTGTGNTKESRPEKTDGSIWGSYAAPSWTRMRCWWGQSRLWLLPWYCSSFVNPTLPSPPGELSPSTAAPEWRILFLSFTYWIIHSHHCTAHLHVEGTTVSLLFKPITTSVAVAVPVLRILWLRLSMFTSWERF